MRRAGNEQLVPLHRRHLALLALLAASTSGAISRDRILALLWEESDETRARDSLKHAVHAIRDALCNDVLITELDELRLNLDAMHADLAQLATAAKAERHEEVIALYAGPFLDGFNLPRAGEFAQWADGERARCAQLWRKSMESVANAAEQRGEYALAAERWRTLAMADPLDATLARAVVRSLARDQNVPAALQYAKTYEVRLRDELGVESDAAFREVVAKVAGGTGSSPRVLAVAGGSTLISDAASSETKHSPMSVVELHASESTESLSGRAVDPHVNPNESMGRGRWMRPALFATILALVVTGSAFAIRFRGSAAHLDPRQFYVGALSVAPDDSSLRTLALLAREQLELGVSQFGSMHVLDLGEVASRPRNDQRVLDQQVAQETAAGTVVRGAIRRLGDTLIFSAAIVDGQTGEVRGQVEPVSASREREVEGVAALRDRLVALMAIQFDDDTYSHLDASTSLPHSLEAYQLFRQSEAIYYRGDLSPALALTMRAYSLDTTFVRALIFAAQVKIEMGDCRFRDSIAYHLRAPAVALRPLDRITWERHSAKCRGDWRTALALADETVRLRPGSAWGVGVLVHATISANQPRRTLEVFNTATPLLDSPAFVEMAGGAFLTAMHALDRHAEELAFAKKFERVVPNSMEGFVYEMLALAALGRGAEIPPILAHVAQLPSSGITDAGDAAMDVAGELRVHADTAHARMILNWADAWYRSRPPDEKQSERYRIRYAAALADNGKMDVAYAFVTELTREHPENVEYQGTLGVLAARRGDSSSAHRVDEWLTKQPALQGRRSLWRARIASRSGDTSGALALLQEAVAEGLKRIPLYFFPRIHTLDDLTPVRATKEFALLMRPEG